MQSISSSNNDVLQETQLPQIACIVLATSRRALKWRCDTEGSQVVNATMFIKTGSVTICCSVAVNCAGHDITHYVYALYLPTKMHLQQCRHNYCINQQTSIIAGTSYW